MAKFLLLTENGSLPPKYEHSTIEGAIDEAKRLHVKFNTNVKILEIVGEIKKVEVPVTRLETKIEITDRLKPNSDLPF